MYRCGKGHGEPFSRLIGHADTGKAARSGQYPDELVLTPLELIDRIAQLVPPPRTHRHRYYGVLAPNSPLRGAVTAMAMPDVSSRATEIANTDAGTTVAVGGSGVSGVAAQPEPQAKPTPRAPARYLWAALIARIYEVFPLICPHCGGTMRIIAFITFGADIHKILEHIGVDSEAPRITPARGPPLWDDCGAQDQGEGVDIRPDWRDVTNQSATDDSPDQRTDW